MDPDSWHRGAPVVRITASNPACTADAASPGASAALLQQYCENPNHRFWQSPTAAEPRLHQRALGHQPENDAWMVELAWQCRGRLVTFAARLQVHEAAAGVVAVIQ